MQYLMWITKGEHDKKLKEVKEKQYEINIQIEDHTRVDENDYSILLHWIEDVRTCFK